ncbi:hypothetical protein EJ05DRAFT_15580 [Pseudovirgaria hyperparasitica]|uniref:Uncharacterized protein n=1 Tax=Pseudovirgaria hyperparasitica TaxID=470096 RepID=A0A6A6WKU7_9PEZI|nr:uncharacterized protein EJ05DRAFT_15580 [Pseudovirgaria hyperparasitica]KAF2762793.1 hypothetical protein EJ05DRAFT_15580 [Pseudovirgaria hyperparasitica]
MPTHSRRVSRSSNSQVGSSQYRHTSRVAKPRSDHNSPQASSRRRTTTPSSKRYTTLDDHFNMMFGYTNDEEVIHDLQPGHSHRPVSWHPGSSRNVLQSHMSPTDGWTPQRRPREHSESSHPQSPFATFIPHQSNFHSNSNTTAAVSYANSPSWCDVPSEVDSSHRLSSHSTSNGQPDSWSVPDWVRMTQVQSTTVSPDILPIQAPMEEIETDDEEDEEKDEADGRELVGMGLYDPPEGYHSWFASGTEPTGKGLKLEETWEPPSEDENSEAGEDETDESEDRMDAGENDASSECASVKESLPPAPIHNIISPPVKDLTHAYSGHKIHDNMSGHSFFFSEHDDDNVKNEWWYQHLRSTTAPTTSLGYGWL